MSEKVATANEHQFHCGFGDRGRKKLNHLNLSQHSTIDSVIHGKDPDNSKEVIQREWMRRYGTHAGMASGQASVQKTPMGCARERKKISMAQASQMDEIIYGHDIDASGQKPHEEHMARFSNHAGKRSIEDRQIPFRKQGMAQCSVMDTILYGRDIDFSGADPHVEFMNKFGTHAGKKNAQGEQKPFRKPGLSAESVMDTVIWGIDFKGTAVHPHVEHMKRYADYAGYAVAKPHLQHGMLDFDNPAPNIGLAQVSSVQEVMYNQDENLPTSTTAKHLEYVSQFEGYAGSPASWKSLNRKAAAANATAPTGSLLGLQEQNGQQTDLSGDMPASVLEAECESYSVAEPSPETESLKLESVEQTMRPKQLDFASGQAPSPSPSGSKRVNPFGNADRSPPTRSPVGSRGSSLSGSVNLESMPRWR